MSGTPPNTHEDMNAPALGLLAALARIHRTVLLVDAEDRIVWSSDALNALTGREWVGERVDCLFGSPERHAELRRHLGREGYLANEPIGVVRHDGSEVGATLSAVGVPPSCGAGLTLAIVRPDSEPLQASEPGGAGDYYRCILDSCSDAVVALDTRGWVTYANPQVGRLLGRPIASLSGLPVALAFSPRFGFEALADSLRPAREGCGAEIDLTRDGQQLSVAISHSPLSLPDGHGAGTVAFLRDVTEQRRAEAELEHKNDELEHYVHAVSHDLRTPLVSLLGFSRLLAQDYGDVLTDTGRHFLERIEQASRTMEALINDLLELSRIGSTPGQRDWIDPLPVLKQLANELKPRLETRDIDLTLPASPPVVYAVRTQLYQVFANLIGNAVLHMGEREGAAVSVGLEETPEAVVVSVRDNGEGIRREDQGRVFEIFHTLKPRGGERRGTGIGLAIVKKIAEAHGGRAWLESEPGEGATFFVSFPRA
jgi:PAS domain S-box-containing protein